MQIYQINNVFDKKSFAFVFHEIAAKLGSQKAADTAIKNHKILQKIPSAAKPFQLWQALLHRAGGGAKYKDKLGQVQAGVHVQGVRHEEREGNFQEGLPRWGGHRQVRRVWKPPHHRRQPQLVQRPGRDEEHRGDHGFQGGESAED